MKIEFFLPMVPPTVTQQEHKLAIRNGKPVMYEPQEIQITRSRFVGLLDKARRIYGPEETISNTPVRLTTKWIWPAKDKTETWKLTRPDTDNLIKLFKDCMTRTGFWKDDALVCSEITEKSYGPIAGIWVRIETL